MDPIGGAELEVTKFIELLGPKSLITNFTEIQWVSKISWKMVRLIRELLETSPYEVD